MTGYFIMMFLLILPDLNRQTFYDKDGVSPWLFYERRITMRNFYAQNYKQ